MRGNSNEGYGAEFFCGSVYYVARDSFKVRVLNNAKV